MLGLSKKIIISLFCVVSATMLVMTYAGAESGGMKSAFWAREWRAMDEIYDAAVSAADPSGAQGPALSPHDLSLYANGLWCQGRYEEGTIILESIQQDFPDGLRAYADMLLILGMERTGRHEEAFERGNYLWSQDPPRQVRYYLAYAMARLARVLEKDEESPVWLRRMYESAPDRRRAVQALGQIMEIGGATADDAASLLISSPENLHALSLLSDDVSRISSLARYALGYRAYLREKYEEAEAHFELASRDVQYGEAARYYHAYSAYRQKKDNLAYSLWSDIALTGFDYPQRSVQRLENLAGRSGKDKIITLLKKVAAARETDYQDVAADALSAIIRLGDAESAREAENTLFTIHAATSQAATIRWERGWKAWKDGLYKAAYEHWSSGYNSGIRNAELASRLLYWQSRALEKLNSPAASKRVKNQLVENYPAEYYAFLVSPDGGIRISPVPENLITSSDLEDWGFVTYARLDGAGITADSAVSADAPILYRTSRLALWEDDFSSSARAFSILQRAITPEELSSSELLKLSYPRAFEGYVAAASQKTGVAPEIIWGVMRQESLYEPDAVSRVGAYGLMQLMPATARDEARKMTMSADSYLRPSNNVMLGANHLAGLFARFKEAPLSLAAYNAGGTPVLRWSKSPITDMAEWVEDIAYRETRGYVKAVLRNIEVYKLLYGGENDEDKTEG